MTVVSADFGKCAACANRMACAARRASRPQAPSARRTADLVSAVACFAFVLVVVLSNLAPLLVRA